MQARAKQQSAPLSRKNVSSDLNKHGSIKSSYLHRKTAVTEVQR